MDRRPASVRAWRGGLTTAFLLATLAAASLATDAPRRLPQILFEGGGLFQRTTNALRRHATRPAIDEYAPPDAADDRVVIRYLHECLEPGDRVWDTSVWFPASYYSDRRPVWHPYWDLGFRNQETSQRAFLQWIAHEQVPVIIVKYHDADPLDALRAYPLIRDYVSRRYETSESPAWERFQRDYRIQILVDRQRRPAGVFPMTGLPCFVDRSTS